MSYNINVPINFTFICGDDAWMTHSFATEIATKNQNKFLLSLDPRITEANLRERFVKMQQKLFQPNTNNKNNANNNNYFFFMNNNNSSSSSSGGGGVDPVFSNFIEEEMNLQIFPKIEELIFRSMMFTTYDEEARQDLPIVLDFIDITSSSSSSSRNNTNNNINNYNQTTSRTVLELVKTEITIVVDAPKYTRTQKDRKALFFALTQSLKNKISIRHQNEFFEDNNDRSSSSSSISIDWKLGSSRHCLELLMSSNDVDNNKNNLQRPRENPLHAWLFGWEMGMKVKKEILLQSENNNNEELQKQHPSFYVELRDLGKRPSDDHLQYEPVSHHEQFCTSIEFLKDQLKIPKLSFCANSSSKSCGDDNKSIALFLPLDAIDSLGQAQLQQVVASWFKKLANSHHQNFRRSSDDASSSYVPPQKFVIWTPPLFSKEMIMFPFYQQQQQQQPHNMMMMNNNNNFRDVEEDDDEEKHQEEYDEEKELLDNHSSSKFPFSVWPSILSKALGNISENAAQCPMFGLWHRKQIVVHQQQQAANNRNISSNDNDDDGNAKKMMMTKIVHTNNREIRTMFGFLQSSLNLDLTQSYIYSPAKTREIEVYEDIFGIKNLDEVHHHHHHNNGKDDQEKILNEYLRASINMNNDYYVKWLQYFTKFQTSVTTATTVPSSCIDDQNYNQNQLRVFVPPDAEDLIMYESEELFGNHNHNNNMMMMMMTDAAANDNHSSNSRVITNILTSSANQQQTQSKKRQSQPFSLVRAVTQKQGTFTGSVAFNASSNNKNDQNNNNSNNNQNGGGGRGAMTKALQQQLEERIQKLRVDRGLPEEPAFSSSYLLFCNLTREKIKSQRLAGDGGNGESLSMKALSEKWNALTENQRHEYLKMIHADQARYKQECEAYVARRKKEIDNPLVFVDTPLEEIKKVREEFYREHGIQMPSASKRNSSSSKSNQQRQKNHDNNENDGAYHDDDADYDGDRTGTKRQRRYENDDDDDDGFHQNNYLYFDGDIIDDEDFAHPDQFEIRPAPKGYSSTSASSATKAKPQNNNNNSSSKSASSTKNPRQSIVTQEELDALAAKHLAHFD